VMFMPLEVTEYMSSVSLSGISGPAEQFSHMPLLVVVLEAIGLDVVGVPHTRAQRPTSHRDVDM
jgi:hypothetical protein